MKTWEHFLGKSSGWLSIVLHPFIIPSYGVVAMVYGHTVMAGIPSDLKFYLLAAVGFNTLVIPVLAIELLKYFGLIGSLSLATRRDRILPLLVVVGCYGACLFMIPGSGVTYLIRNFIIAGFISVSVCAAVNFFWKISLHLTAMGALVALVFLYNVSGFMQMTWLLVTVVVLAGLLASARLLMGMHNPVQVGAGFICGAAIAMTVALYF